MTLVADGDLNKIDPRDLMRRASTTQGECILTVAAGPGYRLAFRDGRLLLAGRGRLSEDVQSYLRRFEILTSDQISQISTQARSTGAPFLMTALRNGSLEHPAAFARAFVADAIFDFVHESDGAFVASLPTQPLPRELPVELEIDYLLDEIDRRVTEEQSASDWLPSANSTITWLDDRDPPQGAHAAQIRTALASGPLSVRELSYRVPAETHTLRIALAHMNRLGLVQVQELPQANSWSTTPGLNGGQYGLNASGLDLDDLLFLSSAEARILRDLESGEATVEELGKGFVRSSIPKATLAYLLQLDAITPIAPPSALTRVRQVAEHRLFGPGMLALATVGVLALAWNRFADERPAPMPAEATAPAGTPPAATQAITRGLAAHVRGDHQQARIEAQAALAIDPSNSDLRQLVQEIDATEREESRLEEERTENERETTRRVDRLIGRALQALEDGESADAAKSLSEAVALDPTNTEIQGLIQRVLKTAQRSTPRTRPTPPSARVEATALPSVQDARSVEERLSETVTTSRAAAPADANSAPPTQLAAEQASSDATPSSEPTPVTESPTWNTQLLVNAVPWGTVYINGEEAGITPLRLTPVPGEHTIEISRAGFLTESRAISIQDGEEQVEAFVLTADIGQREENDDE